MRTRRNRGRAHGSPDLALWLAALAVVAGCAPASAQVQRDFLLHGSTFRYDDSAVKEDGRSAGIYASLGTDWKHLFEVGGSLTRIDYRDGSTLEQTELTAAYSRFGARAAGRMGVHLLGSTDPLTDGGLVLFGGANAYSYGEWSAGAEAAMSRYGGYDGGLTVLQLAPSAGLSFSAAQGARTFGATVRGYAIRVGRDVGLGDRDFLSGELATSMRLGRVTLSTVGWAGEQAFAVRNGGFLVFNVAEVHTGGLGAGVRLVLTPASAISAGVYSERLRNSDLVSEAEVRTFAASLGFTF
jgi:hypothetical protein